MCECFSIYLYKCICLHIRICSTCVCTMATFSFPAVFNDNDFEIFVDPDGSTHGYKEIEINAIRTIFDLLMNKV